MPASEDYTPLDTLKRYLAYRPLGNDPWTNTMRGTAPAPGQGFAPSGADPVLYPTASPLVNITEGDIKQATEVGLAASGGGLKGQQIKAYHSSPHDFDKFDLGKIGTGEGAQVYGHGLYFAENPAVSGQGGQYWQDFQRRFSGPEYQASERLRGAGFDREKAIENVNDRINRAINSGNTDKQFMDEQIKTLQLLESGKPVGPRTYEVNINADPAHMLDWDKQLKAQSEPVQEAVKRAMGIDYYGKFDPAKAERMWKEGQYSDAGVAVRQGHIASDPEIVSRRLSEAGIPGIRYLDEGSRGASPYNIIPTGHGNYIVRGKRYSDIADAQQAKAAADAAYETERTRNYVVFNPSILDIVKKYGLAGLASAPALTSGLPTKEAQP